jgi:hypothetical protein
MPVEMVLHYDHRHVSKTGRIVGFKADVPSMIPDDVVAECVAFGARRTDSKPAVSAPPKPKNETAPSGIARSDAIKAALVVLKEENDESKFAGTGRPKVNEVSKMAGFTADAKEVSDLWDELNGSGNE